jgi:hypothetical protein
MTEPGTPASTSTRTAQFQPPSPSSSPFKWVIWTFNGPQKRRLFGRISSVWALVQQARHSSPDHAAAAAEQLALAELQLERRYLDEAWRHVRAAEKALIPALDDNQLLARARSVQQRALRLNIGWPADEIGRLLNDSQIHGQATAAPTRQALLPVLAEAADLMDSNLDGTFRRLRVVSRSLRLAATLMILALVSLFIAIEHKWTSRLAPTPSADASILDSSKTLLVVAFLGALGAALSISLSAVRDRRGARAANIEQDYSVSWVRPILGAASAVAMTIVLQAAPTGVLEVKSAGVPALAIAAGFTERVLKSAIASLAPSQDEGSAHRTTKGRSDA